MDIGLRVGEVAERRELAYQIEVGRCTLGHPLGWWAAARMFFVQT